MVFDRGLYEPSQSDGVKMNFSFAGCGFLGIYHVGVASCIREYAPHLVTEKVAGASAGAIAAVGLICNSDLEPAIEFGMGITEMVRSSYLGPFSPSFRPIKFMHEAMEKLLPSNAHELASGRLHVSLTRLRDKKNVIINYFETREDLFEALICSAYIPFYCGLFPPQYKGTYYLDGGLSNNIPILDEHTITVSPFAGESDICPADNSSCDLHVYLANTSIQLSTSNLYRASQILFPPSPELMSLTCQLGFQDTLKYLKRNNLISCKRHLSIYTSLTTDTPPYPETDQDYIDSAAYTTDEGVSTSTEDEVDPVLELSFASSSLSSSRESLLSHCDGNDGDDEEDEEVCDECKHRQHVAVLDSLPPQVVTALQAACDSVNQTIFGRLGRFKMLRVVGILASPWVIPAELVYTLTRRFFEWAPQMPTDMRWFVKEFYLMVKDTLAFIQASRHRYSARLTCQLAITDLDFPKDSARHSLPIFDHHHHTSSNQQKPSPNPQRRSINLGFAMELKKHKGLATTHEDPLEYVSEFRQQLLDQKGQWVDLTELDSDIEEANTRLEHAYVDDQGKKHVHLSKVSKLSTHSGKQHQKQRHGSGGHRKSLTGDDNNDSNKNEGRESLDRNSISNDTFDNCLHVAQQMDSILTYHYTSEDDPQTVRVAEIYSLDDPLGPIPEATVSDMSLAWDSFMEMKLEQSTETSAISMEARNKTNNRLFSEIEEETILGAGENMSSLDETTPTSRLVHQAMEQNTGLLALRDVSRISREVHFSKPESTICDSPEQDNSSRRQQIDAASELSPIIGDASASLGDEIEFSILGSDVSAIESTTMSTE